MFLVGDVGGTNSRLALADASGLRPETISRARNREHDSFSDVVAAYMASHDCSAVTSVCIAIAGPVHKHTGRLTNRNWTINTPDIAKQVGVSHADLINDLSALGYALPSLSLDVICGDNTGTNNAQNLVVGMGTGFNVSLTRPGHDGKMVVFEAELGHAEFPASVRDTLHAALGAGADAFKTIEDVFCGSGLERLHRAVSGNSETGEDIMTGFTEGDADATRSAMLFARGLGQLSRSLICQYLPRDGLVFAGSASRGVLASAALPAFTEAFLAPGTEVVHPADFRVSLITEDAAALHGCRNYLKLSR